MVFSQIYFFLKNVKCKGTFFKLIRFLAVFRAQGCFHWLSSPFRSDVMADHDFAGHNISQGGR